MTLSDSELAIAAANVGATVVRTKYGTSLARFEKSGRDSEGASQRAPASEERTERAAAPGSSVLDFATDADVEAEKAILAVLRAARPADAFLGEELGSSGDDAADRTWLIDPLCGTLNFAAQTPLMSVNVALREGGAVTVAASADPLAGEVFWTDGTASYARRDGNDQELRATAATRLVDLNIDPPHPNGERLLVAELTTDEAFNTALRPRVLSTTLALAWVAAGRRAAYVSDGHLRDSVHFAPGIALCQAAGCVVTGLLGQPLHTGVGGLVAAADRETHATLIDIITRLARS